ncbi:Actin cross-linking toxin VgrG1 [Fundidesulfovibrio magnetotacticus]|uniref:Actin cross-linking toxin VgrG1 n=1 Tax=Fundidesulfovibrio magnetotacticus TaxID=2730080 RepID=A0A6V8LZX6_9BACT|nr:type VI secretion system tip protein TssI/VgrG [Fundidesulfovibrio magnetotacticus]GFK95768.1 Actin cross-linking toxin VgrG1 [Fundidesulfovibrio magnetotacticus]
MNEPDKPRFAFEIEGFSRDAFHVVRFTGEEGLSRLFRFEVTLFAGDKDVDFDKALAASATLTIRRREGDVAFHGILESLDQTSRSGPHTFFRAVLVPKAWLLTQTTHHQIFLHQDIPRTLEQVFQDAGLSSGLDFRFALSGTYPQREFVCQYGETHYAFASRWMEHEGLYHFFERTASGDVLVVTDALTAHKPMPQGHRLRYSPPSSMQVGHEEEVVTDFALHQRRLPKDVVLKDYDYEKPSLDLTAKAPVKNTGQGTLYLYGQHFKTISEGERLARVRAQELLCREKLYAGVSSIPFVRPGHTFEMSRHFTGGFNREFLTIGCRHEGSQEAWLVSGLGLSFGKNRDTLLYYRNAFTAIPSDVQFRPELSTERPRIAGTLPAKIDAEGSGQYAEVDAQGRYKIILPFDLSGRKDGHASAWVRMAQPYAGQGHGMHFPLHKGTEVVVSFQDGDPDRPLIAGAVPNPETQSPVTDANQTQARITTAGGNRIHMEDQEGSQRILLHSTPKGDFVRIGEPNDPPSDWSELGQAFKDAAKATGDAIKEMAQSGINITTPQWFNVKAEFANTVIIVENTQTNLGLYSCNTIGLNYTLNAGMSITTNLAAHTEFAPIWYEMRASVRQADAQKERLIGQVNTLLGQKNTLADSVDELIAAKTNTLATKDEVTAAKTDVAADVQRTYATKNELTAQKDTIAADYTQAIANKTSTLASKEEVAATKDEVIAEGNHMAAQLTQMINDKTALTVNVTNVTADNVLMAGTFIVL